jgi:hypothetical protein
MKNIRDYYPLNTFSETTQNEIVELFNKTLNGKIINCSICHKIKLFKEGEGDICSYCFNELSEL